MPHLRSDSRKQANLNMSPPTVVPALITPLDDAALMAMTDAELEAKEAELAAMKARKDRMAKIRQIEAEILEGSESETKMPSNPIVTFDRKKTPESRRAALEKLLDDKKSKKRDDEDVSRDTPGATAALDSSECTDSSDSTDEMLTPRDRGNRSRGKRYRKHKLRSGLKDKLHSSIRRKERYPHAALLPECLLNQDEGIEYNNLTLGLYCAGELEIINHESTPLIEKEKRIELLINTCYRSEYLDWTSLLNLQRSILTHIERGNLDWSSSFTQVESHIFNASSTKKSNNAASGGNPPKPVAKSKSAKPNIKKISADTAVTPPLYYCNKYQSGDCPETEAPHYATIDGQRREVHHICAICYRAGDVKKHNRAACTRGTAE